MEILKFENGFKITYKGIDLISHSKDKPFMYVGTGIADYNMYRGNFKISDYLVEKIALLDYEIEQENNKVDIKLSRNNICYVNLCIEENKSNLLVNFTDYSRNINRIWIRIAAESDEHVYGCGEQFSYFDLRGKKFPLFTTEQGVGRNKKTLITALADIYDDAGGDYYSTFYPQPTFISNKKYFCHVDESTYMNFDFTNENYHELEIWNVPNRIYFGAENNYKILLQNLTQLLGRQTVLPDWVIEGICLGIQGGTDVVKGKVERALKSGIKVTGVWCQDWEGKRITSFGKRLMWNWIWDKNLYPGLDKYIKELNEKGIKFLGYINPYLATDGSLYKEAAEKGYIVKRNDGSEYVIDAGEFYVGIVDLTNPDAFNWYKGIIKKYMIDFGISGWMADFGEYLPIDVKLYNNISGEKMHNLWPVLWAKVNREAIEEAGKTEEIIFFMRAGYSGCGRYNLITWAGDQNVDWSIDDGLASVIVAALSLGMSGMGIHHSDIGGYTTLFDMKRSKELLLRWTDFAAFTPIMRTHEGNRPADNWQFDSDEETLKHFERMTKIHSMLKPYIKEALIENANYGIPVMRPLFLNYEEDKNLYDLKYEYMLGDDLIVAPVYESSKSSWKAYLPRDKWVHLWSKNEYDGGYIEVESPIGYPPVFYKKNSKYEELFKNISMI
ncbi:alpha-glucosidase [Caloramator quimbayensis]|uniref:Alpha-glucosidase n=1 Tax=Caloramator quimbayensis TaxID=1147123 RepID=A0A1T4XX78_9CLOT|nr:alpha-glucosidase [Caloramator quimbayensis]SKA93665.1 alpha-glucosidase [Caloramator quimbayensis]